MTCDESVLDLIEFTDEVEFACVEELIKCVVSACNNKSYSIDLVGGVYGRNTAIDNEETGISVNTGRLVKAPRIEFTPAPCVTKITVVSSSSLLYCS